MYIGKKPNLGDFVGLSKKPGYVTKCRAHSKYRCGKIVEIVDKNIVKILIV